MSYVDHVDRLINADPRGALAAAERAYEEAGPEDQWCALGALAGARRACGDYDGARAALAVAIELTGCMSGAARLSARLDLARRLYRLLYDLGQYSQARPLAEWRVAMCTAESQVLARADLAALVYVDGGTWADGRRLLSGAFASPDPELQRYAWQMAAAWAIAECDDLCISQCLDALERLPLEGAAGRDYRWLCALRLRARGECHAAAAALLELSDECLAQGATSHAGVMLLDAAICGVVCGDDVLVTACAGRAFAILTRLQAGEVRAAVSLLNQAAQRGQLTRELALALRKRALISRREA